MRFRIVATVVLLLFISSITSVFLLRQVLFQRLDDEVTVSLRREAEEFQLLSTGDDPSTGEPFGDDYQALFDVYFAREVPDEGESLLAFVDGRLYQAERAQGAADAGDLSGAIDLWLSLSQPEEGSISTAFGEARYVALPLTGASGSALFVVANFPAFEREEIDDAVQAGAFTQLVTLVLASLLGLVLAGRVLRPLRSLADTARMISETDLRQRIPVQGEDEASMIAGAFNDMVDRLEDAFAIQRRFLDDASHELRTPLTVIRGHVELLELDHDPEERRAAAEVITDEIDRMDRIVNDLLLLARAEQPDFLQLEPVRLRDLLVTIHRKVTALGPRDWRVELPDDVVLAADPQRLAQAMVQLADNACRHTSEGATITVGAQTADGRIRLWVHERGRGVADKDTERIFQRFTRGSPRTGDGGAGLGLSIVRAIAEAHHGTVRLVPGSEPGAGSRSTSPSAGAPTSGGPRAPSDQGPMLRGMNRVRISTTVDAHELARCRSLLGPGTSKLVDRALRALAAELERERDLAALQDHPYEDDPDLAWTTPVGPDLPYDGEVPEEVQRLARTRRSNRAG